MRSAFATLPGETLLVDGLYFDRSEIRRRLDGVHGDRGRLSSEFFRRCNFGRPSSD